MSEDDKGGMVTEVSQGRNLDEQELTRERSRLRRLFWVVGVSLGFLQLALLLLVWPMQFATINLLEFYGQGQIFLGSISLAALAFGLSLIAFLGFRIRVTKLIRDLSATKLPLALKTTSGILFASALSASIFLLVQFAFSWAGLVYDEPGLRPERLLIFPSTPLLTSIFALICLFVGIVVAAYTSFIRRKA